MKNDKIMGYPPILMRRQTAACYLDMAESAFLRTVASGQLPQPIEIGGKKSWYRPAIDKAIEAMTGDLADDWSDMGLYNVKGTWREDSELYKDDPDSSFKE